MREVDEKCINDFSLKNWNREEKTWDIRLKEVGHADVDWIHLLQDTAQWRTLVNTIRSILDLLKTDKFFTS
jgi:hypothetical protein